MTPEEYAKRMEALGIGRGRFAGQFPLDYELEPRRPRPEMLPAMVAERLKQRVWKVRSMKKKQAGAPTKSAPSDL